MSFLLRFLRADVKRTCDCVTLFLGNDAVDNGNNKDITNIY